MLDPERYLRKLSDRVAEHAKSLRDESEEPFEDLPEIMGRIADSLYDLARDLDGNIETAIEMLTKKTKTKKT